MALGRLAFVFLHLHYEGLNAGHYANRFTRHKASHYAGAYACHKRHCAYQYEYAGHFISQFIIHWEPQKKGASALGSKTSRCCHEWIFKYQ